MTAWLTGFVGIIYLFIAGGHFLDGRTGLGLAFAGYALANVGLILAERGQ